MVISAWATDGTLDAGGLGIFVVPAAASLALVAKMFRSVQPGRRHTVCEAVHRLSPRGWCAASAAGSFVEPGAVEQPLEA